MTEQLYVDDGDLRRYRIELPNLIDDMNLTPQAFRLYAHIKRVTGANGGKCWQSTKTLAAACRMSAGTISKAKRELIAAELITMEPGDYKTTDVIRILNIWPQNFAHYSKCSGDEHGVQEMNASVQEMNASVQEMNLRKNHTKKEPYKKEPYKNLPTLDDTPVQPNPPQQQLGRSTDSPTPVGLLTDSFVDLQLSQARKYQHIEPELVARHVFEWERDMRSGKVNSVGALVARLNKANSWRVPELSHDDRSHPYYVRHFGQYDFRAAESRANRDYMPATTATEDAGRMEYAA